MLTINVIKKVDLSPAAQTRWNNEYNTFVDAHKYKDTSYDASFRKHVGGDPKSCFINNMPDEKKPWYFDWKITTLFYILCLGWIPKLYFDRNVYKCDFKIIKYVDK